MIIYRSGIDLIPIKIQDVTFWITPLNQEQKLKIIDSAINDNGEKLVDVAKQGTMAMRLCIKEVEGLETSDGKPYKLKFDKTGELSVETINDLLSLHFCQQALVACYQLMINPQSIDVKGVDVDLGRVKPLKKKSKTTTK